MSETNLLPCPFCGELPYYLSDKVSIVTTHNEGCFLQTNNPRHWNTRTQPEVPIVMGGKGADTQVHPTKEPHPTPSDSVDAIAEKCYKQLHACSGHSYNAETKISIIKQALHSLLEAKETGITALEACNEQWKHTAELAISENRQLTSQIERMREALEVASKVLRDEARDISANLCDKALKSLPPSQFVLIERSELKKWPCGCKESFEGLVIGQPSRIIKCPRCIALERK